MLHPFPHGVFNSSWLERLRARSVRRRAQLIQFGSAIDDLKRIGLGDRARNIESFGRSFFDAARVIGDHVAVPFSALLLAGGA